MCNSLRHHTQNARKFCQDRTTVFRVRADGKGYALIKGLHRLEALRALDEKALEGYQVKARLH